MTKLIDKMAAAMFSAWQSNEMSPDWVKEDGMSWERVCELAEKNELYLKWKQLGLSEAKAALDVVLDELYSPVMDKVTTKQIAVLIDADNKLTRTLDVTALAMVAAVYDVLDGENDGEQG